MDLMYLLIPSMLLLVVLATIWLERFSVPVILVALGIGIVCGGDILGLWPFDDVEVTRRIADLVLVFILFHGGFGLERRSVRPVAVAAGGLATWGVLITSLVAFLALRFLFRWPAEPAGLVSVILSSTDATATFSILRRQPLPEKLASTLEVESASNDPMAILLTVLAVEGLSGHTGHAGWWFLPKCAWQFAAGPLLGWGMGLLGVGLFNRLKPAERGHYYVLFVALVLMTYGVAESVRGSGMLAVFVAGYVMGNHPFVYRQCIKHFSAALSTLANIGMFILLGLLASPKEFGGLWLDGVVLFVALSLLARPAAVWLGTAGMRIPWREKTFMSWAGLRGAVPIVLATYPAAAGLPHGQEVFNLVFFTVILSMVLQGATLGPVARWLGLSAPQKAKPLYDLELVSLAESDMDLVTVELPDGGGTGVAIRELRLPPESIITLVTRGPTVIAPTGAAVLRGGDAVTVLTHIRNADAVRSALTGPFEEAKALADAAEG